MRRDQAADGQLYAVLLSAYVFLTVLPVTLVEASYIYSNHPDAPPGPTYMPQYKEPAAAEAGILETQAAAAFLKGEKDGSTSDKYVRLTVVLASILFLVGISTHFPLRGIRYGLIGLSIALLVLSLVQLAQLPRPPS